MAAVRLAQEGDVAAITAVELSAGEMFAGTHMAWAVGETTPVADLIASIASGDLWVAVDADEVVGFLRAEQLGSDFYVDEVAVAGSHARQGVGRLLIEAALAEAVRRGHLRATLTTDRDLPWNAPYYARLGFRLLAHEVTPPELAARLASQPSPDRRCAMACDLGCEGSGEK